MKPVTTRLSVHCYRASVREDNGERRPLAGSRVLANAIIRAVGADRTQAETVVVRPADPSFEGRLHVDIDIARVGVECRELPGVISRSVVPRDRDLISVGHNHSSLGRATSVVGGQA